MSRAGPRPARTRQPIQRQGDPAMDPTTMNRRNFLTAAGLGAGAVLVLPSRSQAEALTPQTVFFDPDAPVLGNPNGDVTIAEFFDYQCPFCKKDYPILESFLKSDPNVRLVMKDWPVFGPPSVRASHLVFGASTYGQYETAFNALMSTKGLLSDAQVTKTLTDAGIDVAKAQAGYEAQKARWDGLLARNEAQAQAFGLQGTPAFIIGRTIYPGYLDAAALRKAVAEARSS